MEVGKMYGGARGTQVSDLARCREVFLLALPYLLISEEDGAHPYHRSFAIVFCIRSNVHRPNFLIVACILEKAANDEKARGLSPRQRVIFRSRVFIRAVCAL